MAAVLVYTVAHFGSGGPTPIKLILSGVIVMALLGSWTSALLLLDLETLQHNLASQRSQFANILDFNT